jgi:hypothetical protein
MENSLVYLGVKTMAETAMFIGYTRILDKIKRAGAVSEKTAKTASELGLRSGDLKRLKRWVKETSDGRFYVECKDKKHC